MVSAANAHQTENKKPRLDDDECTKATHMWIDEDVMKASNQQHCPISCISGSPSKGGDACSSPHSTAATGDFFDTFFATGYRIVGSRATDESCDAIADICDLEDDFTMAQQETNVLVCSQLERDCMNADESEHDSTQNPLLAGALQELKDRLMEGGDPRRMAEAWNSLGLVRLHTQRNPREAIMCHENALCFLQSIPLRPLHPKKDDSESDGDVQCRVEASSSEVLELVTTYHDLGLCYERLHDISHAMEAYQKAKYLLSTEEKFMTVYPIMQSLNRSIGRLQRKTV